jgi:hypothetical protein
MVKEEEEEVFLPLTVPAAGLWLDRPCLEDN